MTHILFPIRNNEGFAIRWDVGFFTPVVSYNTSTSSSSQGGNFVTIASYRLEEYEAARKEVGLLNGATDLGTLEQTLGANLDIIGAALGSEDTNSYNSIIHNLNTIAQNIALKG